MRQLTASGLHKAFGTHPVLTGVDLEVPAGLFTAILGPSGSGKTTLLRLLAGFERADAGTISIGGRVVDGPATYVPPERRQIGYVPQEGALFPHLTVAANVAFGLSSRERRGPRAAELLAAVGLAGLGGRYPHELSGGQQQRVALARALAIRPEVVLLDEPFASLDAHMRASVRADVQRICRSAGTTAILVTHDQDEALSMADRIAVLRDGKIVQYAAPQELYNRPADAALARFVGDANLIEGRLTAGGPVGVAAGGPAEGAAAGDAGGVAAAAAGGVAAAAAGGVAAAAAGGVAAGEAAAIGLAANGARADAVDTILGRLPLDPACTAVLGTGPVTVLIRPEQLALTPGPEPAAAGQRDYVTGHVVACEYYGHDAVVRVQPDGEPGAPEIVVRTTGGPQLPTGSAVTVRARGPVLAWSRG